jgi:hypothetical protein
MVSDLPWVEGIAVALIHRSQGSLVNQHISGFTEMILPPPQMLSLSGEECSFSALATCRDPAHSS